jgi:hypothetical protein
VARCFGIVNPATPPRRQGGASRRVGNSLNQNHSSDCAFYGESPLSRAVASCSQLRTGIVMGGLFGDRGNRAAGVLGLP